MYRVIPRWISRLWAEEAGAVLAETIIVVPVLTVMTIGTLEFANIFWQRQQMQIGVRDAVRYWSRCRPTFNACTVTMARNIAFYGNAAGTGSLRVPGWDEADELTLAPAEPPTSPDATSMVTGVGTVTYVTSPFFGALEIDAISFSYTYSQRYIGW
ncbi:TadE/TadG family type IV pilus assembly protein [Tabrizicola oligotrophica]|uniref:Pilus assembly protein n=1 Tax=Tabrizicola oligotrophica TaxID=2710650 RepID=A0A6M0QUZ8_9RHOB|nr:TadE/TadG family type IV pilus assembly protein [Tabrizicola oligotrophica]NEY91255.1 pilus assembly protein [Tabrizicola oligotrophica]